MWWPSWLHCWRGWRELPAKDLSSEPGKNISTGTMVSWVVRLTVLQVVAMVSNLSYKWIKLGCVIVFCGIHEERILLSTSALSCRPKCVGADKVLPVTCHEGTERSRCTAVPLLDLSTKSAWVVSTMPWPLHPQEKPSTPFTVVWVGFMARCNGSKKSCLYQSLNRNSIIQSSHMSVWLPSTLKMETAGTLWTRLPSLISEKNVIWLCTVIRTSNIRLIFFHNFCNMNRFTLFRFDDVFNIDVFLAVLLCKQEVYSVSLGMWWRQWLWR